ncbi:alpha/beta fold hydrolase [Ruegeria atlantica]|uniref:alpha/beta fold hydrolase n=1 Tax=Ruegeria atlantica TaxID=81569 RepID=UPI001479CF2F|nr:alpha/beta fold hydrolase [Ruegeria atlantica]
MKQRLSAILAADMVGYSRLMEVDELGVLSRQKKYRRELIDPEITRRRGNIVKTTGDGMLATFESVQDAVQCAVKIQQVMSLNETELDDDQRIRFRVGINLGDVIFDEGDIFGDGVNVAARLEGLAEPGGVCVSDIVHQAIQDRIDAPFRDMGGQRVKNISRPIRVWHWSPKAAPAREVPEISLQQRVKFCNSADGTNLAWASTGEGVPILKAPNWLNHIEHEWTSPVWGDFLSEMSKLCQLVRFDQRGNGLSDWDVDDISEDRMIEDMVAVADASGLESFGLLGISQGSAFSIRFAARYPERVKFLVLLGGFLRGRMMREDAEAEQFYQAARAMVSSGWGSPNPVYRHFFTSSYMPDATPEEGASFDEMQRISASPEIALRILEMNAYIDASADAQSLKTPTLVLHSRGDMAAPISEGRKTARAIPTAEFIELPGANHCMIRGHPGFDEFFQEIEPFLKENSD